jgi:predicted metal-dependent RNase
MFKRVETADMRANIIDDVEPCIVLATSGMMSGGPVLEYFKGWADNPLHALLFVGFQSEGSLGRRIQREAREITLTDRGQPLTLPIKLDLETIDGFSGHSDRLQLLNYVGTMEPRPERVIVNHGEEFKCADLASGLYKKFGLEARAPMNLETIRLK